MKKFVVHVSNPTTLDERVIVTADEDDLAAVAHQAVREVTEFEGGVDFPIFIDIHEAEHAPNFEPLRGAAM